ncbi:uncharacterized protein LOC102899230 isoform X2 [Felis catus]|uniref:uncharacterized protein LOC102899230 isoform X2 n=1 Tax=Felis catus TaxID=9685 RepID=UPI001D19A19B|nr:uncharacterized protein LOC102899230 isoform X2 [Felis catus]
MGHSIRLSCGPTTATCWLKTSDEGLRCADPGFHLLPHRFQMSLLSRSPSSVPHGVESLEDGWRLRRPCSLYPKVKAPTLFQLRLHFWTLRSMQMCRLTYPKRKRD